MHGAGQRLVAGLTARGLERRRRRRAWWSGQGPEEASLTEKAITVASHRLILASFASACDDRGTKPNLIVNTRRATKDAVTARKSRWCLRAPMTRVLHRPDTVVIERPDWYQLITPSAPGSVLNEVVFSELADRDADRVVAETVASYRTHGHPTKWCVGPWTKPDDFGDRLTRHGFRSWDVRGMGCATGITLPASERLSVSEVTEANLEVFLEIMLRGWSLPARETERERLVHLRALRGAPRTAHFFAASLADEVVGTAGLVLRGEYAYLLGTQVLEAARGRGAYRALVSARLAFLQSRGVEYAVTQAREATSAPMLEHFGFETLFRSKCYLRELPQDLGRPKGLTG